MNGALSQVMEKSIAEQNQNSPTCSLQVGLLYVMVLVLNPGIQEVTLFSSEGKPPWRDGV